MKVFKKFLINVNEINWNLEKENFNIENISSKLSYTVFLYKLEWW